MTKDRKKVNRKALSKRIRFEVFKRDNFTCQYCGRKAPDVQLVIDHIYPVALGGDNDMRNLVTSCSDCNNGKSDRELWVTETGFGDYWTTEEEYIVEMFKAWMRDVDTSFAYKLLELGNEIVGYRFYAYVRKTCKNYRAWKPFVMEVLKKIITIQKEGL